MTTKIFFISIILTLFAGNISFAGDRIGGKGGNGTLGQALIDIILHPDYKFEDGDCKEIKKNHQRFIFLCMELRYLYDLHFEQRLFVHYCCNGRGIE